MAGYDSTASVGAPRRAHATPKAILGDPEEILAMLKKFLAVSVAAVVTLFATTPDLFAFG